MAVFPDVPLYLKYGHISGYLAANDNSKKRLLQGGALANWLPNLLEIVTESVEWKYNLDSTDESLNDTALYLYALCGRYRIEADDIINAGTTGNLVNPSTGNNVTLATPSYQFKVGEGGALMTAGQTTLPITLSSIVNGSAEITLDGVEVPYGRSDVFSFTATYSATNVIIVFSQSVINGQLFLIHLVQLVNV